jgi:ApaG protein
MQTHKMIDIDVETHYIEEQSIPEQDRYVFAYTITIANIGELPAKLLRRHWIITDSDGNVQEVRGEGVVGEQPDIAPGDRYRYTSGTILETPVGTMQGSYLMRGDDGMEFDAEIPAFTLAIPHILH